MVSDLSSHRSVSDKLETLISGKRTIIQQIQPASSSRIIAHHERRSPGTLGAQGC